MDRLTQLQECSLKISELFYTAIGVLQRDAPLVELHPQVPVTCWTEEQIKKNWEGNVELAKTAARDIAETVKVVDVSIDTLPGISESEEDQLKKLMELEKLNQEAEVELSNAVKQGQIRLNQLQEAIQLLIEQHHHSHRQQ